MIGVVVVRPLTLSACVNVGQVKEGREITVCILARRFHCHDSFPLYDLDGSSLEERAELNKVCGCFYGGSQ
jgi:hypothetical protein